MSSTIVARRTFWRKRQMFMAFILVLALGMVAITLVFLGRARLVQAGVLCVKPGGGDGCQDNIQTAIDLAMAGDTIQVAAGEYTEYVHITQTLTLQGGWAPDFSVRDVSLYTSTIKPPLNMVNPDSVVWIQGQNSDSSLVAPTLDGFLITGGRADLGSNHGGGLKIQDSDAQVISNTIRDNAAFLLGGGMWVQRGAPMIQGNTIISNTAVGLGQEAYGGGVQLEATKASLVGNLIASNVVSGTGSYGGGIDILTGSDVRLDQNLVFTNTARSQVGFGYGGGISLRGATVLLSDTTILDNWAQLHGGGIWINSGSMTMHGGTLVDNRAIQNGGGLLAQDLGGETHIEMISSTVSANSADQGAGIFAYSSLTDVSVLISKTLVVGNFGSGNNAAVGGIVNIGNAGTAVMTIIDSQVISNTATDVGGVYNNAGINGAGIMTVTRSLINGNIAGSIGGIWNNAVLLVQYSEIRANEADGSAGGIRNLNDAATQIIHSEICDNVADADSDDIGDGGGIYNKGVLDLTGVTVCGNSAASFGGGIFSDKVLTITNSLVKDNQADDGAGIFAEGGSVTSILSSTVRDNTTIMGGGAGINNNGALLVQGSTFSGNQTTSMNGNGAGILNNDQATIVNTTVSGNVALGFGGGVRNAATITLTNVTVASNTGALGGGGVQNMDTALATNTIIAGNSPDNCSDPLNTLGFNLEDTNTCALNPGLNDLIGLDPFLGPLADNGGLPGTSTHALTPGSPAIDAGNNASCPAVDQRGGARPEDGDGNGSAICDIGAYEYGSIVPWLYLPLVQR